VPSKPKTAFEYDKNKSLSAMRKYTAQTRNCFYEYSNAKPAISAVTEIPIQM